MIFKQSSIRHNYIFGFNLTNSSIDKPDISLLFFSTTNAFELSWKFDLAE